MPNNAPYGPNSNPTGAALVRFTQINPFDTDGDNVVDRIPPIGLANFPPGSSLQVLRRNATNTALEWHTIAANSGGTAPEPLRLTETIGTTGQRILNAPTWAYRITPTHINFNVLYQIDVDVVKETLMLFRNGLLLNLDSDYTWSTTLDVTPNSPGRFQLYAPLGAQERLQAFYYRGTTVGANQSTT